MPTNTSKPNRVKTCELCNIPYMITIIAYTPVRVMVSCACNVQFLTAEEAKEILEQGVKEMRQKDG